MIIMKFGGSSLASAASFSRVLAIVQSHKDLDPVVIASAMGDTTDDLLQILSHARRGQTYQALKLQDGIKNSHFEVCEQLLDLRKQEELDAFLRETFRNLHVRMLELAEGERALNPELQDWTLSIGEQLSSRLLAAALGIHCGKTVHLDARKLILTASNFTNAKPKYWESYARIRWAVPAAARDGIPVLGGFIGSTEDGRTTTLGRGGSDLTASIVGAALNAEEIQVWKDVDGLLTCDPRVLNGGSPVPTLSYEEAAELAKSGATILHPETMAPARRLRIPIVIRNTFSPAHRGTRIESRSQNVAAEVKSIAIRKGVTLLEVRSVQSAENLSALTELCNRPGSTASVLCSSENTVYLAIQEGSPTSEDFFSGAPYVEARARYGQAILTLVGDGIDHTVIAREIESALPRHGVLIIPDHEQGNAFRFAVPQSQLQSVVQSLHRALFPGKTAAKAETSRESGATISESKTKRRAFAVIPKPLPSLLRR